MSQHWNWNQYQKWIDSVKTQNKIKIFKVKKSLWKILNKKEMEKSTQEKNLDKIEPKWIIPIIDNKNLI